tara:strand:- start:263 stop:1072 length:810 start_codon:yes stop_codon:yes gene_type:complete
MFDFHFGTRDEIIKNDEEFVLFTKRMLPRWINGIPDSECLALYRILKGNNLKKTALIETGCGASSIALVLHAILNDCKVVSWDTNPSKGSFLKSVINEAICKPLNANINDYWEFIAFDSTNNHLGIAVLNEMNIKPSVGFFDSLHTLEHLMSEIKAYSNCASDIFYVVLDDANYTNRKENFSYINMLRTKLKLSLIEQPESNVCKPYHEEIEQFLSEKFKRVERIENDFEKLMSDDIYFDYFQSDWKQMIKKGMAKKTKDRFVSFKVEK